MHQHGGELLVESEEDKNYYIEYNYIQIAQILERIMDSGEAIM